MSYISGARLVDDKQVKIASTKIDGIGPKKAIPPKKKALRRQFLIIEILRSPRKFLGPDVEALISVLAPSIRALVLSEQAVRGDFNYRIGVWSQSSLPQNYKKRAASVFQEIPKENFFAESKKGLGGWARFLCDKDYTVLLCSGKLSKKNLFTLSKNAQSKKKLLTTEKPQKVGRLDKGKAGLMKKKERKNKKKKRKAIPNFFVRSFGALLTFLLKIVRMSIWVIYNKIVGQIAILLLSFYFFFYKGAKDLKPEHLEVMDGAAVLAWLLDYKNPGGLPRLPKPWGTRVKELFCDYGFLIKFFYLFFYRKRE